MPFSRLSIIPLSVPLSHLIGVGETQAPSQRAQWEQCGPRIADRALGSAKIELEIFHLLFSMTKGPRAFLDKGSIFNGENQSLGGSGDIVSRQLYRCVRPTAALIGGGRGQIWWRGGLTKEDYAIALAWRSKGLQLRTLRVDAKYQKLCRET